MALHSLILLQRNPVKLYEPAAGFESARVDWVLCKRFNKINCSPLSHISRQMDEGEEVKEAEESAEVMMRVGITLHSV